MSITAFIFEKPFSADNPATNKARKRKKDHDCTPEGFSIAGDTTPPCPLAFLRIPLPGTDAVPRLDPDRTLDGGDRAAEATMVLEADVEDELEAVTTEGGLVAGARAFPDSGVAERKQGSMDGRF